MIDLPDIDIDVADRNKALSGLTFVKASMVQDGELRKHPTGIFCQKMPVDPISGLAVFPSGKKSDDIADLMGFYKIDMIPNTAYEHVRSPKHMDELLEREMDWSLLYREEVVQKLQHINGHFEILQAYEPKNIDELACLIAIIRPGKRHLIGEEWDIVKDNIWKRNDGDQYTFKKSHAIAFAMMITVQLKSMIEAGVIQTLR
jgi:hypothetical protein